MKNIFKNPIIVEALKRNNHHSSLMNPMLKSKVLKKINNLQIEITEKGDIVETNGWHANWVILYGEGKFASDYYISNKKFLNFLANVSLNV